MEEYIEFFQNTWLIIKAFIFEWLPLYEEMERAAWGPFADIKELFGTIGTIGAVILATLGITKKRRR